MATNSWQRDAVNNLLIPRLERFYRVPEMCSSQHLSDEIAARLYNETCLICWSSPASTIQLDELVVENLIPEVNPLANARKHAGPSKISLTATPWIPANVFKMHPENARKLVWSTGEWLWIQRKFNNVFLLEKITEIALVFHVTHSYFQLHQLQNQDAGPFNLQWRLKTLSKWKFTHRCFGFDEVLRGSNVNRFEVQI